MLKKISHYFWAIILIVYNHAVFADAAMIPPDIKHIVDKGVLVVELSKNDFKPFYWHDQQGNLVGYSIDLANNMAAQLGVKVKFDTQAATLDEAADLVAAGKADVVFNYTPNVKRAEKVIFSHPYLTFKQALLVNRLERSEKNLPNDAIGFLNTKGIMIGASKGMSEVFTLQTDYPDAKVILYQDIDQAMQDVSDRKLMAVLFDDGMIYNWLAENPKANLYTRVMILPDRVITDTAAVSWQSMAFRDWINVYLAEAKTDGVFAKLNNKYFGSYNAY